MSARYDIEITTKTQVAIHTYSVKNYVYNSILIGNNPFGPRGGACGKAVDATEVFKACSTSKWLQKLRYSLYLYVKAIRAIGGGTLTVNELEELEKYARKRSTTDKDCMDFLFKKIKKEDLPLLINEYEEEDKVKIQQYL